MGASLPCGATASASGVPWAAGRRTVTVVPSPTLDAIPMWPPWRRTMEYEVASPRPVPVARVVKNGSKTRGRASGGMPCPLSWIEIST